MRPSSYDLGEALRLVLLSVTEGEDKPVKYPTIFNSADVAIITKSDLAVAVEFDEIASKRNIQAVRPGMEILRLSAKTGEGMANYLEFPESRRISSSVATAVSQYRSRFVECCDIRKERNESYQALPGVALLF